MYTLHWFPGNANLTPHMLLEELGVPFSLSLVDRADNAQRSAAYLALNPHGRIPTLVDHQFDQLVVYETAAICLHLVDQHAEAGLAPAVGTAARARFYQWMMYLTNTVQTEMHPYFYPERHVADPAAAADVKATAERRLAGMFDAMELQLSDGPYVLGDDLSVADHFLFMLTRWTRNMTRPARTLPNLGRHAERMWARPAVKRAFATEGLGAPYY